MVVCFAGLWFGDRRGFSGFLGMAIMADFCTGGLVFNGGFRGLATDFSVLGCCGVDSSWLWGGVGFPCWGCLCPGFALCGEFGC